MLDKGNMLFNSVYSDAVKLPHLHQLTQVSLLWSPYALKLFTNRCDDYFEKPTDSTQFNIILIMEQHMLIFNKSQLQL